MLHMRKRVISSPEEGVSMKPRFTKPPYQPKWVLQLQVFVLRLLKSKMFMIVTTTGRKTGLKRTIPIDYCVDGESFLAFNMGGGPGPQGTQISCPGT